MIAAASVEAGCYGLGCGSEVTIFFPSLIACGLATLLVMVMLSVRRRRHAGLWLALAVLALGGGLPLLTQGWIALKVARLEPREVTGSPPPITKRTPFLIVLENICANDQCDATLAGTRTRGMLYVRVSALETLGLKQPISLADLPLIRWPSEPDGLLENHRSLKPEERRRALAEIDNLIVTGTSFLARWPKDPGEKALARNRQLQGIWGNARLSLALVPLERVRARSTSRHCSSMSWSCGFTTAHWRCR